MIYFYSQWTILQQTKNLSNKSTNKKSKIKYERVLKSLLKGCKLLEKNKCKFEECRPFAHYKEDVNSVYFAKIIDTN